VGGGARASTIAPATNEAPEFPCVEHACQYTLARIMHESAKLNFNINFG
jgi:hypothetical protein